MSQLEKILTRLDETLFIDETALVKNVLKVKTTQKFCFSLDYGSYSNVLSITMVHY